MTDHCAELKELGVFGHARCIKNTQSYQFLSEVHMSYVQRMRRKSIVVFVLILEEVQV